MWVIFLFKFLIVIYIFSNVTFSQGYTPKTYDNADKLYYVSFTPSVLIDKSILLYGISAGSHNYDRIGYFVHARLNFAKREIPDNAYYETISYEEAKYNLNDKEVGMLEQFECVTAGISYPIINNRLHILAGIGYQHEQYISKFFDRLRILGDNGYYYFSYKTKTSPAVTLGATLRIVRWFGLYSAATISNQNEISLGGIFFFYFL